MPKDKGPGIKKTVRKSITTTTTLEFSREQAVRALIRDVGMNPDDFLLSTNAHLVAYGEELEESIPIDTLTLTLVKSESE